MSMAKVRKFYHKSKHSHANGVLKYYFNASNIVFFIVNFDHFQILRAIGKGAFGKVKPYFLFLYSMFCVVSMKL